MPETVTETSENITPAPDRSPSTSGPPVVPPVVRDSVGAILRRLGPAALLAAFWTFAPAIMGTTLLIRVGPISEWLRGLGDVGPVFYVACFVVAAGIGVLPTYSQAIVGGWAFGFWTGTAAALTGFVGGSIIGYAIARKIGRTRVEAELDRHPKWRTVRDALVKSGRLRTLLIVGLVRLPPNSPFSLTNLVLSTSGTPLWAYITGTALGMLPRTAVTVWLASNIGDTFDDRTVERPIWWLPMSFGITALVFVVLYFVGLHALNRATRDLAEPSAGAAAARPGG